MSLGYSHPVEMEDPKGIQTKSQPAEITIRGSSKQLSETMRQTSENGDSQQPYKGKGIRYVGEAVPQKRRRQELGARRSIKE
jgi:large subunit ribosomal protein L6